MAEDREVLREVWNGRIPACFNLSSDEVFTVAGPDPYYLMLPRLSYLPICTDKVKKHFSKFVSPDKQSAEIWFDFDGVPLKWHLPIGVLYDQISLTTLQEEVGGLPWNVTVHFGNYPVEEILRCDSRETVEAHFMSCIKEADHIKHGGRVVSVMQKKDHNQLWQGLLNDKFDQFWAINRKLMESNDGFRHIPIRLYQGCKPLPQRLVKSFAVNGKDQADMARRPVTLHDLIEESLPNRDKQVKVLLQGIQPDWDTPLQWLSEHLSYPDNFLHICLD